MAASSTVPQRQLESRGGVQFLRLPVVSFDTGGRSSCNALFEVLETTKSGGVDDRIKLAATKIRQALIEAEATSVISAGPWEYGPDRTAHRNVNRPLCSRPWPGIWSWRSQSGGRGRSFRLLLERWRRVDRELVTVAMKVYLHGVLTRKLDDLVKAWGNPRARGGSQFAALTTLPEH